MRRYALQTVASCAAILIVGLFVTQSIAQRNSAEYRFENVTARLASRPVANGLQHGALVAYTAFGEGGRPGWRRCEVSVLGDRGRELGHKNLNLFKMDPSSQRVETFVPYENAKSDPPRDARIVCTGQRLDDPAGYYSIRDVNITSTNENLGAGAVYQLTFHEEWVGDGMPGAAECVARVYDAAGALLFEEWFNFMDAEGEPRLAERSLTGPTEEPQDAESATLECNTLA